MGIGLMNFYNNSNSEFTDFTTHFQSYVRVDHSGNWLWTTLNISVKKKKSNGCFMACQYSLK